MKNRLPVLFLFLLISLFFSKAIFSKNKVFAPIDLIYAFEPWSEYNQIPPQKFPQNFRQTDALLQFIPWRFYGYGELHKEHFPLNTPYEYGGIPFFANDQSGVLSPYNLIGLLFGFKTGFLIIAILKLLLAAMGMYLFLDLFSLHKPSLIIGSIAYTFSSLMIWFFTCSRPHNSVSSAPDKQGITHSIQPAIQYLPRQILQTIGYI